MPNRFLESYELCKNAFEFLWLLYCIPTGAVALKLTSRLSHIEYRIVVTIIHIHQTPIPPARSPLHITPINYSRSIMPSEEDAKTAWKRRREERKREQVPQVN